MLSYRKLAMRVLGRPLHTGGGIDSPRPASQRAAAFILTAAMLTTLAAPAFAGTWYIENGDITVKAGDTEGTNKVSQGTTIDQVDTDTIITNRNEGTASSNTVTIEAEKKDDKVEVTFENVNIEAGRGSEAAVSVTGKGDTNIELNGDNELKSGNGHAGLEHNKTDTSGELTIQDKDKNGSLTATAGSGSAGIGGSYGHDGEVTISGGTIDATSNNGGAGIGGGKIDNSYVGGNGTVKITGGNITAKADGQGAGIGGGYGGNGTVEITGGDVTATGGYSSSGIGGGAIMEVSPSKSYGSDGDVTISGGTVDATGGDYGAGIGGGYLGDGKVNISGNATIENAKTGSYGAGIGGGGGGNGDVTVSGNATIENAEGGKFAAGIGGGYRGDGNVTISGNAKIDNVSGGKQAAGIGSSFLGDSTITIKDNAAIGTVTGGSYGAGVGGGALGVGDVTIEGNVTIKNAQGGSNAAGIGGGYGAENDKDGNGNQITIKSNESGAPTVNATGGVSDVDSDTGETIPGGAGIGSGASDAKANITLEGKVTIVAKGGEGNAAIGDMNGEQVFTGLAEGTSITRCDSEGNDISLPGDKVPVTETSSGGGSADASVQESVFPGLVVTDKSGQRISYTSTQSGNTLTVCVGRLTASLHVSLAALRQLRAEGIDTITFQTVLRSTTLSVDELLAMGGEDTEVVLIHHIRSSTLTVGGKAM